MDQVVSLYDYSGEALKPWAAAGYACTAYDLAHQGDEVVGGVRYRRADLHDLATLRAIVRRHRGKVAFLSAFPVCTDLASSGATWWAEKARHDPAFQTRAARHANRCAWAAEAIQSCPSSCGLSVLREGRILHLIYRHHRSLVNPGFRLVHPGQGTFV